MPPHLSILLFIKAYVLDGRDRPVWSSPRKAFLFESNEEDQHLAARTMADMLDSIERFPFDTEHTYTVRLFVQGEIRKQTPTNGINGNLVRKSEEQFYDFECRDLQTSIARIENLYERLFHLVEPTDVAG